MGGIREDRFHDPPLPRQGVGRTQLATVQQHADQLIADLHVLHPLVRQTWYRSFVQTFQQHIEQPRFP